MAIHSEYRRTGIRKVFNVVKCLVVLFQQPYREPRINTSVIVTGLTEFLFCFWMDPSDGLHWISAINSL